MCQGLLCAFSLMFPRSCLSDCIKDEGVKYEILVVYQGEKATMAKQGESKKDGGGNQVRESDRGRDYRHHCTCNDSWQGSCFLLKELCLV